MKIGCVVFLLVAVASPVFGQAPADDGSTRQTVANVLGFEKESGGNFPIGWHGSPAATIFPDDGVVHSGKWSARLERKPASEGTFTTLTKSLPVDFAGDRIDLRGFLKTDDVKGFAGLWMREDGTGGTLQFGNMQDTQLQGTTEWTEYTVSLPVDRGARTLFFGFLLQGTGKVWADDLQLVVDGKPIAEAAALPPPPVTVLDRMHDFDAGSGLAIADLDSVQIENLVTLGRVWGFLKYHHPAVTAGQFHWDYEMLRVLPLVLKSSSKADAEKVMVDWIDRLGAVPPCKPCPHLERSNLSLEPDLGWLDDPALLGRELRTRLKSVYENRPGGPQFYVSLAFAEGNPTFDHELDYGQVKFPDAGFQLLALYRFWNIMQYWAPDREVAGQDWPAVLREFIPRLALAKSTEEYKLGMLALIAKANDTHANLWSSLEVRPPVGECQFPVNVRFIEGRAVVTSFSAPETGPASGFKIGDVLERIDGSPVAELTDNWRPFYADSNEAARLRDMGRSLTQGVCGAGTAVVRRGGDTISLKPARVATGSLSAIAYTHDLAGPTFRLLSKDVAYLKLSSVKVADLPGYIDSAKDTKGLIVDIRNYPSEFVVFALGQMLVTRPAPFARFSFADLANPGAFDWGNPVMLQPAPKHYAGKVVILVDEVSQSQAEYTTMALRAAPNALVVGSTTAGADGNVSRIPLPGSLSSLISGLGIFYPDKTQTQRTGVRIDIKATPTIAGVKAGRDEVLETGIRQILGPDAPAAEVERLAHP